MRDSTPQNWIHADKEDLAKELECFETPEWAVRSILDAELLTKYVWDVCNGPGILERIAAEYGYCGIASDIYDWQGDVRIDYDTGWPFVIHDFINDDSFEFIVNNSDQLINGLNSDLTIFMNPPFSKAVEFVEQAIRIGARKIVCFQRFAWWESKGRRGFWDKYPPSRVYVCGDRASCWRADIPESERKSGTTTAHAWFVWEQGQNQGTQLHRLYKDDNRKQGELL